MKYIIGLTGNIATGKSVVSGMLEHLGAKAIDADALVHELMEKGTPVWQAVVQEFGEDILAPDGSINRKKLGSIVFADEAALGRLEAIVHPAMLTHERPRSVLILGGGDLGAAEEVLKYPVVERVVQIDIDPRRITTQPHIDPFSVGGSQGEAVIRNCSIRPALYKASYTNADRAADIPIGYRETCQRRTESRLIVESHRVL